VLAGVLHATHPLRLSDGDYHHTQPASEKANSLGGVRFDRD
jgi:hypothetical protein